jgi:hypothetical protein
VPESRYKYLYERLGDHDFQLLINALLTGRFPDFVPLPLRQADGGRDGITRGSDRSLVYQVKWSVSGKEKDPVNWLDRVVKGEAENLKRLAKDGVRRYVLVTNVPSTGKAGTGSFDALDRRLAVHAKEYGLEEMSCFWREAVDGMVDNADDDLLWKYADMLAGWELIRYLVAEDRTDRQDVGLRKLVRKVAAVQWDEDELVKFSQVDIDREKVADLFVDVNADRLKVRDRPEPEGLIREPLGGAADFLLKAGLTPGSRRCILVRGAPGQGKSTLSQYVSQVHRSAFVPSDLRPANLPVIEMPLFPIRVDLSDYARWMSGADVFDNDSDSMKKTTKRPAAEAMLEWFLADVMSHASGASTVVAETVQELFSRVPSLVVLDGLDEVGRPSTRANVVKEIDNFARRARTYNLPPRVVVTTRPSTNELPEPSAELFDVIVLTPLTGRQREDYLRKWSAVHGIFGSAGRTLRTTYRSKIAEPYLDELASNPMQLTILLDLLHKRGEATPDQRTALYDSYVDLLLAREANKHPESVRKHQTELREIIPFLGWHLQAHSEADRVNARMSLADLKASIRHFQRTYGNPESVVDELFEAASDRLWALTSKLEGTYEFEVLSLREYFAANFLYRFAGEERKRFDRIEVLRELLQRPYWLNTARFYGGNAEVSDLSALADGIVEELRDDPPPHAVVAGWTLLIDGVFTNRPRYARDVLESLCADEHLRVLVNALNRGEISPLPTLPMPVGSGEDPTWTRLTALIAADPAHHATQLRVQVLRELLNQKRNFATWWTGHIVGALTDTDTDTDTDTVDAWLEMAALCGAAAGHMIDLTGIDLSRPLVAQRILDTGLVPPPGGEFEDELLRAVLDGLCPNVQSVRSLPAQVAVAFAPEDHLTKSPTGFPDSTAESRRRRQEALKHLQRDRPALAEAAKQRRFGRGQRGSTFPWANIATALFNEIGPCWLTSQIGLLGAASPMRLGLKRQPDKNAFGINSHPAALLEQTRANAGSTAWWRDELATLRHDTTLPASRQELSIAEWCLALWCTAEPAVVVDMFPEWENAILGLPGYRRHPVIDCALRCSAHGWISRLPSDLTSTDPEIEALVGFRNPTPGTEASVSSTDTRNPHYEHEPLIEVARKRRWFKVDDAGAYR